MKLSIFPKAKALPKSKEEKNKESKFTSKPHYPELVTVNDENDLIEVLCNNSWSPSIFNGYRNQDNFVSTDFMVLDIDDGMTIDEAYEIAESLDVSCLCLPSTSHTEDNHRFRLVFPLARTIFDKSTFEATMQKLAEVFPADPSCIGDTARFYFGAKPEDGFFTEGELLTPKKGHITPKRGIRRGLGTTKRVKVGETIEELTEALYGSEKEEVPEQVAYWLENAPTGLEGEWHNVCNSAIFTLGLQGIEFEVVEEVFRQIAPEELDDHDEYLLDRAWNDGYNSREEEDESN